MVTESEKSKHDMLRAMRKHIRENGITDFIRAVLKARMKSGELAFTDALNEEDAKRIEVVSLLKCVPGIGASKAEAIRRLVKIPLGRRVSGLGIRQREELTALEKNGWKMTAQKSKAL